jgi:hypothetical protein
MQWYRRKMETIIAIDGREKNAIQATDAWFDLPSVWIAYLHHASDCLHHETLRLQVKWDKARSDGTENDAD